MKVLGLAILLLFTGVSEALAWGQEGHSIVAEIAQRRLTPAARQRVSELLAGEFPGLTESSQIGLASIASWADDYRALHDESANWHFVDIPMGTTTTIRRWTANWMQNMEIAPSMLLDA
jgi:hypothetical protein